MRQSGGGVVKWWQSKVYNDWIGPRLDLIYPGKRLPLRDLGTL